MYDLKYGFNGPAVHEEEQRYIAVPREKYKDEVSFEQLGNAATTRLRKDIVDLAMS
jgi:hypothetical protein